VKESQLSVQIQLLVLFKLSNAGPSHVPNLVHSQTSFLRNISQIISLVRNFFNVRQLYFALYPLLYKDKHFQFVVLLKIKQSNSVKAGAKQYNVAKGEKCQKRSRSIKLLSNSQPEFISSDTCLTLKCVTLYNLNGKQTKFDNFPRIVTFFYKLTLW
jgi:hypothetical protein